MKFNYCGLIERGTQRGWTPEERGRERVEGRGGDVLIQREEEESVGKMEEW